MIETLAMGARMMGALLLVSVTAAHVQSSATAGDQRQPISGPAADDCAGAAVTATDTARRAERA